MLCAFSEENMSLTFEWNDQWPCSEIKFLPLEWPDKLMVMDLYVIAPPFCLDTGWCWESKRTAKAFIFYDCWSLVPGSGIPIKYNAELQVWKLYIILYRMESLVRILDVFTLSWKSLKEALYIYRHVHDHLGTSHNHTHYIMLTKVIWSCTCKPNFFQTHRPNFS